jgi:hypothetical protein
MQALDAKTSERQPKRCGSKTKSGGICKRWANANGRCKFHGGNLAPPGPTHHSYKHGRYSSYMPDGLKDMVEEALADPNILELTAHVAILDARVRQLVSQANDGAGSKAWMKVRDKAKDAKDALDQEDYTAALSSIRGVIGLCQSAIAQAMLWQDILDVMDEHRKLTESEIKRRKEGALMLTAEQAMLMIHRIQEELVSIVRDEDVPREKILASFGRRLQELTG